MPATGFFQHFVALVKQFVFLFRVSLTSYRPNRYSLLKPSPISLRRNSIMSNLDVKHLLYHQVSLVGRALGHEIRLEILEFLSQCPQTVDKLARQLQTDIKSVSAHLQVLSKAGLVFSHREGRFHRYYIRSPKVCTLAVLLRETAESTLDELALLIGEQAAADGALGLSQAVHYAAEGRILLIDVRPHEEYLAGHLPHAVNLPVDEIESSIDTLPEGIVLAAYCRGPYCFLAREAAKIFAEHGRRLRVIDAGVMEWESHGEILIKGDTPDG